MRIFRYELEITDQQTLELPLGYKLLSVAPGRSTIGYVRHIDLWVQVPERASKVPAEIQIVGTGNPMLIEGGRLEFIGTAVMPDGLVWHVFERWDAMRKS